MWLQVQVNSFYFIEGWRACIYDVIVYFFLQCCLESIEKRNTQYLENMGSTIYKQDQENPNLNSLNYNIIIVVVGSAKKYQQGRSVGLGWYAVIKMIKTFK